MKNKLIILSLLFSMLITLVGCVNVDVNQPPPNEPVVETPSVQPNNDTNENTTGNTNNNQSNDNSSNKPSAVERDVRLFYYDVIDDKIIYTNETILVKNKAVASALINALKNPSNAEITPVLASTINIKSATLDSNTRTIKVDFSENFVKDQNLGSGPEAGTLKALVNTLGYNFDVDNVIITIGGKSYSSGHILMNDGESFKVDYNNVKEFSNK